MSESNKRKYKHMKNTQDINYSDTYAQPSTTEVNLGNRHPRLMYLGGATSYATQNNFSHEPQILVSQVGSRWPTNISRPFTSSSQPPSIPEASEHLNLIAPPSNNELSPVMPSGIVHENTPPDLCRRRPGRKSMNFSEDEKRARNRSAVAKHRQRQNLQYASLEQRAQKLVEENNELTALLQQNYMLNEMERETMKRGIQMSCLLRIKESLSHSLPKELVRHADSLWEVNAVLSASMPTRCYYGIESIRNFWQKSLRMRNKGKILSFWAWLFTLPPGERFEEFDIQHCLPPDSNFYCIHWKTKSIPQFAGAIWLQFGGGHRVVLHVESFGKLVWHYLLTSEPFPSQDQVEQGDDVVIVV